MTLPTTTPTTHDHDDTASYYEDPGHEDDHAADDYSDLP
jgi:hypothetical protein